MGVPADERSSSNEVPELYDEIRPSYPAALFDAVFELPPVAPTIIEVGPGTGRATVDLLSRGARVHAVEIGPATAATLRRKLPSEHLQVRVDDIEAFIDRGFGGRVTRPLVATLTTAVRS